MFKKSFLILAILALIVVLIVSPNFKEIAGGVAIFLFGMKYLQVGFKGFTGGAFDRVLQKSTDKTWKSVLFGFSATSIMQSSSLVSVITISFLSAELISLMQGIGILLGSSIGNTTGIWLIAGFGLKINIGTLAMPLIVLGIIFFLQKNKILNSLGSVLAGFGFVFLGIHYMKIGFESFSSTIDLTAFAIEGYLGVIVFMLIGLLMTIIMQSSTATVMLILTALASGQISYENSLALTIGANIGTSVTSFAISLTGSKDGKRVCLSDLMTKIIASLIFMAFFYQFMGLNNIIANSLSIEADNYPLRLALYHSLFNIVGVTFMLIFINKVLLVIKKVFPNERVNVYGSIYLNKDTIALADTAIISLIKETRHLYYNTIEVVLEILGLKPSDIIPPYDFDVLKRNISIMSDEDIDTMYNKKIKLLFGEIIDYTVTAEGTSDEKHLSDFGKIKEASLATVEIVKGVKHLQKNLRRYLKSSNIDIRAQYENIVVELIDTINCINRLKNIKNSDEKLFMFIDITRKIGDNDIVKNGVINSLIREHKITSEMATSLMNDSNYKKEILKCLLTTSKIIFHNDISEDKTELRDKKSGDWLSNNFGIGKKQLNKLVEKYRKQSKVIKQQIEEEKDKNKKVELKKELDSIKYFVKTFKK